MRCLNTPLPLDLRTRLQFRLLKRIRKHRGHWLWFGHQNEAGYGRLRVTLNGEKRRQIYAHRLSYAVFKSAIPDDMHVGHARTCERRNCINPDHLLLQTPEENFAQRSGKSYRNDQPARALKIA